MPPPTAPVAGWHVSPVVDVVAYHFSWLLILVPLALAGEIHPTDYLAVWAVGITTSFVHRHVTMPYVYLDDVVFQTHKPRFTLIPAILLCGFVASVFLQNARAPSRFLGPVDVAVVVAVVVAPVIVWWRDRQLRPVSNRQLIIAAVPAVLAVVVGLAALPTHHTAWLAVVAVASVVAAVAFGARAVVVVVAVLVTGALAHAAVGALNSGPFKMNVVVGAAAMIAAAWNVWHTAAQKVGILRVYNAKSSAAVVDKVPLWVDRLLVFGWFPFLAAYLVVRERETILEQGKVVRVWLEPLLSALTVAAPVLLPAGIALIAVSLAVFLRFEWKSTRFKSTPRLSMALGLTLLSASFLFASPLKVYVAYGFSHAVEYVVFVWAFQRRRYAVPLSPPPLLQRILKRGLLFYSLFIGVISVFYLYVEFGTRAGFYDEPLRLWGIKITTMVYCWAIWHSFAHFYFDGFLWKMRLATVRASL